MVQRCARLAGKGSAPPCLNAYRGCASRETMHFGDFAQAYAFEIEAITRMLQGAYPEKHLTGRKVAEMLWFTTTDKAYVPPRDIRY